MPKHRKLLIVIADGEHVRYVRPAPDNALRSNTSLDSVSTHKQSADLGTDHPGAAFHSDASAHHALAPRHDSHLSEKERFARLIAQQLNDAASREEFDELVLVAPPHSLSVIQHGLDGVAGAKVIGTLPKDLVKVPDEELWPHVRAWVRPVHRVLE